MGTRLANDSERLVCQVVGGIGNSLSPISQVQFTDNPLDMGSDCAFADKQAVGNLGVS